MNIKAIEKLLNQHSIPCYIANNRIYADSMISGTAEFEEVVDLTDYSKKALYEWLGY